jgi:predicted metal-dependent peptidase
MTKKMKYDVSLIKDTLQTSHPLIEQAIIDMIAAAELPFYGEFALFLSYIKANIGTMGVTMTMEGGKLYWDEDFVNEQTIESIKFLMLHEIFHLLLDHPERSVGYDKKISNIAQDMIINTLIYDEIMYRRHFPLYNKIKMPVDKKGRNSGVFVPKEYTGELVFEPLYIFLKDELKKRKDNRKNCDSCDGTGQVEDSSGIKKECPNCNGSGNGNYKDDYGPHGKEINNNGKPFNPQMQSLDNVLDNIENSKGMTLDAHIEGAENEVDKSLRQQMVQGILDNLKSRGLVSDKVERILNKLRKSEKDHLKEIKRSISNDMMQGLKNKSITRPNRRDIQGLKGKRKYQQKINAILDTSGSMDEHFEHALSFIFQKEISINLVQIDTEIKNVIQVNNMKQLETMKIEGLGGTFLSPGLQHIAKDKELNKYNTVILTDGMTDNLDCSGVKGNILVISNYKECGIKNSNGKIKQIIVEKRN